MIILCFYNASGIFTTFLYRVTILKKDHINIELYIYFWILVSKESEMVINILRYTYVVKFYCTHIIPFYADVMFISC